jgi:hypothetical protein
MPAFIWIGKLAEHVQSFTNGWSATGTGLSRMSGASVASMTTIWTIPVFKQAIVRHPDNVILSQATIVSDVHAFSAISESQSMKA